MLEGKIVDSQAVVGSNSEIQGMLRLVSPNGNV